MFADGFANLRFLAGDIPITDVESPIANDRNTLSRTAGQSWSSSRNGPKSAAMQNRRFLIPRSLKYGRGMGACCTWSSFEARHRACQS